MCKSVYYCSKQCQITHWPTHKAECKAICLRVADPASGQKIPNNSKHLIPLKMQQKRGTNLNGSRAKFECCHFCDTFAPRRIQKKSARAKCENCNDTKKNISRCIKCKSVYYCSKACQTMNWSIHKAECKTIRVQRNKAALRIQHFIKFMHLSISAQQQELNTHVGVKILDRCFHCGQNFDGERVECGDCHEVWYCSETCKLQHEEVCHKKPIDFSPFSSLFVEGFTPCALYVNAGATMIK